MWIDTDKGARYHLFSFPCLTSKTAPLKFPPSPIYGDCKILFCGNGDFRLFFSDGLDRKSDLRCAS